MILCSGAINSPILLYNSGLIDNPIIYLKDHKMYRLPLLNLKVIKNIIINLFSSLNQSNLAFDLSLTSLKETYIAKSFGKSILLGIYNFPKNMFSNNKFLNFLISKRIICFSQIYLGDEAGASEIKLNLNSKDLSHKIVRMQSLNLYEWVQIIKFYISKNLLIIPYNFSLDFGSSYHIYGSLDYLKNDNLINKSGKCSIFIAGSSSLTSIGSEPSSFPIIINCILY